MASEDELEDLLEGDDDILEGDEDESLEDDFGEELGFEDLVADRNVQRRAGERGAEMSQPDILGRSKRRLPHVVGGDELFIPHGMGKIIPPTRLARDEQGTEVGSAIRLEDGLTVPATKVLRGKLTRAQAEAFNGRAATCLYFADGRKLIIQE